MTTANTFALCVFFLLCSLGIIMVIQSLFKPLAQLGIFKSASGFDFIPIANKDAETGNAFKTLLSFLSSTLLGSNALTFFLAWLAFHDSVKLAWWALWYWPIMFLWHFIIYKKGTPLWYVQIAWIILSVAALLVTKNTGCI